MDQNLITPLLQFCLTDLQKPEFALSIVEGDRRGLMQLHRKVEDSHPRIAKQAQAKTLGILKRRAQQPDVSPNELALLGRIYAERGKYDEAAAEYRRALTHRYEHAHWRIRLARALAATGKREAAIHEARVCLRFRPEFGPAKRLIEKLSAQTEPVEAKAQ
jgi:tetratricopeptide (TPR) repeat protein